MKVVVISRSDSTGGAAVVSRRLTEALREKGLRAGMLVLEKKTDLPFVIAVREPLRAKADFLAERAQIFLHNGFSKKKLWKVDTASFGLPLWQHPMVMEADAVILNWVNQGMLSLDGVSRISVPGRKVIWTMHDMWNFTGICHHAMECRRYLKECGKCPFLTGRGKNDLSHKVWLGKEKLYNETDITFVPVSRWLDERAEESSLLKHRRRVVIPNPFSPVETESRRDKKTAVILFSAAVLDNWIKGLDIFRRAIAILAETRKGSSGNVKVRLMGAVKNPAALEGFALPADHIGLVEGEENLAAEYSRADIIVNCSEFENLPGTLVEGQSYGAVPVAFDRGGQKEIIDHKITGYLAEWDDSPDARASNIAGGLAWALDEIKKDGPGIRERMKKSVKERYSYDEVASRYIDLLTAP